MEVIRSIREAQGLLTGCALAIGNFDGVHLGHRRLLEVTRERAGERGAKAALLTFDPHPAKILSPEFAPPLITTIPRKIHLLEDAGLDVTILQPFDWDVAATSPETFVRRDLVELLGVKEIVVGYDFTFGKGRAGTPDVLAGLAGDDARVHIVPAVTRDGLTVSSSKVRELVLEGRVAPAMRLLGHVFTVDGSVVPGRGRGRTIGVPTANVAPETELLPAPGVYAARAAVEGVDGTIPAAVNIGRKPTFGEEDLTVEVHLLDFSGDVYGRRMAVAFLERLRAEQRFGSVDELVAKIRGDLEDARQIAERFGSLRLHTVPAS